MARSSYIYIVLSNAPQGMSSIPGDNIIAAFTVKHEMETFCEKNLKGVFYTVKRIRDNPRFA